MNDFRLKQLEEKYWQGETTLEEERELKSAAEKSPEALSPEFIQLVDSLKDEIENENVKLDDSFESEFWEAVEEKKDSKIIRGRFTPLEFVRYAAAAVVIVCFSFAIWYAVGETSPEGAVASVNQQEQFESPEEAFEEAKKALTFASSKLNKAKKPLEKIEKFHQATMSVAGMSYNKTNKDSTNESD
jgi:predicted RNase H-like HicB family nuclease